MSRLSAFFIYNSSLDLRNGSNTHILELTSNLLQRMNIMLFAPANYSSQNHPHYMIPIRVVGSNQASSIIYQVSYQVGLFFKLLYYCSMKKPNLIYERSCGWSILPVFIAKAFKIPYIVEVNGLFLDELKASHFSNIYINICAFNERRNYQMANKIIVVTKGIKEEIINLYNVLDEKIVIINNGANTDLFVPMDKSKVKYDLNLDSSLSYICFVGNLVSWQGVEYLIKAAPFILKEYTDVRFLIVGEGIMKKEWMQLADDLEVLDKFVFAGRVSYEKVPMYINASDICIAPFIKERNSKIGLSALKTYEYLACGKPLVASGIPGVKDLIEVSGGGISVTPEDPGELADAIIKLLPDKNARILMGDKGRRYVVENHSWYNVASNVLSVCNNVVKNH